MDEFTGKRRGRPRKVLDIPNAAAEGENAPCFDTGNGQAGEAGPTARAEPEGQGKGIGWLELVELVKAKTSHEHRIACVIHPEAVGLVETAHLGSIRTRCGEPGYQLNTGELINC